MALPYPFTFGGINLRQFVPITHQQFAAAFEFCVPPEMPGFCLQLTPDLSIAFFFVPPDELLISHVFDVN